MYALGGKKIWVAGHSGMVGSAVVRRLGSEGATILTARRGDVDLMRQAAVEAFVAQEKPDAVVIAAAKVGGILANETFPVDFLYDNLMIATNIMQAAHLNGVEKVLFLGSSCIYPKLAPQPIAEDALLTGPLEPTNQWYAIAKIAGIKLAQSFRQQYGRDYICATPTNLYGPRDNFDLTAGHVMAAIIRKAHEAKVRGDKQIVMWGTGTPRREFLHVDDGADALVFLLKHYSESEHVNVGSGEDMTILALTELVCNVVGYDGQIVHDLGKPDGTPRKLMRTDKLYALGWAPRIALRDGIVETYRWFLDHVA